MTDYSYVFYSLRDEAIVAEIPMFGTFFQNRINQAGQGNGSFQLDMTGKRNSDLVEATIPGRTAVAVERNGTAIWTGITWSRTYQSQAKTAQLFFWGFESYPNRQRILTDFVRTFIDPVNIFRDLWLEMQAVPGRNLNVNVPASLPNVEPTNLTVNAFEIKYYGEAMADLSDAKTGGFDWTIDVTRVGNQFVKSLRIGRPNFGVGQSSSSLVFEYPGSITNYFETESMASAGTHLILLGSGENEAMITSTFSNNDMIAAGWPRWDIDISRKDIQNFFALYNITQQQGVIHRPPMSIIKATLKADKTPAFGTYALGDNCTLVIRDPKHPTPLELQTRLIGWELHPQSSQDSEEVTLSFAMELDA